MRYDHAHGFWDRVLGYAPRENNLRALVIDLLQNWFLQYQDRTNNTHRHEVGQRKHIRACADSAT